jgi:arabinofuranosyltransferase
VNKSPGFLPLLPLVALFTALQTLFYRWIPDDAFISFRYARQWSEGMGLVFNPGEKVEGFSNLLWVLLLGAVGKAGGNIVSAAVWISMLASIGSYVCLFTLFRSIWFSGDDDAAPSHFLFYGFSFAAALFFPLIFYASSGLESTSYLLCLLGGACLAIEGMTGRRRSLLSLSIISFLLASLMRPEGILFLLLHLVFLMRSKIITGWRATVTVGVPVVVYTAVILIKSYYYGEWIPNTFFAKPGMTPGYATPLAGGSIYLALFFSKSGLFALLPFAFFIPPVRRGRDVWIYMWGMVIVQILFIIYVGADVLRFDRFSLPFTPFILALALMGARELLRSKTPPLRIIATRTIFFCLLLIMAFNIFQIALARRKLCAHDWMHSGDLKTIGLTLAESLPENSMVVANEIGAIAYYSNHRVVDMLGLTDKTISRIRYRSFHDYGIGSSPWSTRKVTDYLYSRRPDCIILPSYGNLNGEKRTNIGNIMHPLWLEIYNDKRLSANYRRECSVRIHLAKYLHIYILRDIPFTLSIDLLKTRMTCGAVLYPQLENE